MCSDYEKWRAHMRKYYIGVFIALTMMLGCAQLVRVDADTYLENQDLYKGKQVLLQADLEDVVEHYTLLKGKNVELAAPVDSYGDWGLRGWYVFLEKDGKRIRCYEEKYRYYLPWKALYLVRWAQREKGVVTARGKLKKDGVELCQLAYKGLSINTNAVPSEYNYSSPDNWYYMFR